MTDLQKLSDTMREWSTTAGDHHWLAHLAIKELIAVRAQVEQLRDALSKCRFDSLNMDLSEFVDIQNTLKATPAQCLAARDAEIKAQAGRDGFVECYFALRKAQHGDAFDLVMAADEYANQLRQQAKAGDL